MLCFDIAAFQELWHGIEEIGGSRLDHSFESRMLLSVLGYNRIKDQRKRIF